MIRAEVLQSEATRSVMNRVARGWDLMPEFVVYSGGDEKLDIELLAIIDNAVPPEMMPAVMSQIVMKFREEYPELTLTAVGFTFEGYGVSQPGEDAPESEKERFDHDHATRRFSERDDRQEMAMTVICDHSTGLVASSQITRGENDEKPVNHLLLADGDGDPFGGSIVDGVKHAAAIASISAASLGKLKDLVSKAHLS